MTKAEVARLLTMIAAFDRRTIGETDVEAWHLVLADLEPTDCADAVREHFASKREWLMPADVRTYAVAAARRREGQRRIAERDARIAAENPGEIHARPVAAAITAGTPPRPPGFTRYPRTGATVVRREVPPFTPEELAAARELMASTESADV